MKPLHRLRLFLPFICVILLPVNQAAAERNGKSMKKRISIGTQGFETLRNRDCFYVDKTDFIREWWESEAEVTLITRPRRFGKTLNMDTLNCFFSNHYKDRGELFEGLSIWKNQKYQALQGTYPVIFLSFAGVKANNYADAKDGVISSIYNAYGRRSSVYRYRSRPCPCKSI